MKDREKITEKVLNELLDLSFVPQKNLYEAIEDIASNNKVSFFGTKLLFKDVLFFVHNSRYFYSTKTEEEMRNAMRMELTSCWDLLYSSSRNLWNGEGK